MRVTTGPSGFVDVHAHVVPSGDDGAQSVEEGIALCRAAADAGTSVLFATPHMHAGFDQYPWGAERAHAFDAAFPLVRAGAAAWGVDLRRGREVYPSEVAGDRLDELALEGTTAVLVEFPGGWLEIEDPVGETWRACEAVAAAGLVPVLAHPERCRPVAADPGLVEPFADAGWLLCPNAGSLVGDHGAAAERAAWTLVERGLAALVASDAHRPARPPDLLRPYEALVRRVGAAAADALTHGAALPWRT